MTSTSKTNNEQILSDEITKKKLALFTKVTEEDIAAGIKDEYGALYSKDGKRLLKFCNRTIEEYTVKEGTEVICDNAFDDCLEFDGNDFHWTFLPEHIVYSDFDTFLHLNKIILPDSLRFIGMRAFFSLDRLERMDFPDNLLYIGSYAFGYCRKLKKLQLPTGLRFIDHAAFYYCWNLSNVQFPKGLQHIEYDAFECCESLFAVELPSNLQFIHQFAFRGCDNLSVLKMPDTLISIGTSLFEINTLRQIIITCHPNTDKDSVMEKLKETLPQKQLDNIIVLDETSSDLPDALGDKMKMLLSLQVTQEDIDNGVMDEFGVVYSKDGKRLLAHYQCYMGEDEYDYDHYTVKEGTEVICNGAFAGCDNIDSITLPQGLKYIGIAAFHDSTLENIKLPKSLRDI